MDKRIEKNSTDDAFGIIDHYWYGVVNKLDKLMIYVRWIKTSVQRHHNCHCLQTTHFPSWVANSSGGTLKFYPSMGKARRVQLVWTLSLDYLLNCAPLKSIFAKMNLQLDALSTCVVYFSSVMFIFHQAETGPLISSVLPSEKRAPVEKFSLNKCRTQIYALHVLDVPKNLIYSLYLVRSPSWAPDLVFYFFHYSLFTPSRDIALMLSS